MIIVDTSTLVSFFLGSNHSGPKARKVLGADTRWAAPQHQPAEVINTLRGLVNGGKLSADHAAEVLKRWSKTSIKYLAFTPPVISRMWELRSNVTAYDAAYVAVAEEHAATFVTGDRKLAAAPDIRCDLRLVT